MHITDTVAIVTGGASGLGLATTRALTAAGAHVVILDLVAPAEPLEGTTFVTADVTRQTMELGTLRILVNCAGIAPANRVVGRDGPVALELFERTIRINLIGTFNVLRLVAAAMQRNEPVDGERGVIVNTASVAAFDGQIGQAAYSASKGAIAAMTLPIAREFAASLIRVMTIAPGVFETPMMAAMSEETKLSLGSQVPHPARLGRPDEYAALARHIVENPYLNGETIRLDGAIRMTPR